jgi:LysR family transcriptional regulator, glycine cleavage system transcriptional activator
MRYPSMTALRALDAVARLGSVSEAAAELNLTPSAISHQIKSLEQTLGFALTERTGRNIRITWQGERYARDIHGLLANILEAGQRFDGQQVSGRLCISSPAGFATYWLCTHIADFQALYPQVELHLISPRTPDDTSDHGADLFIAYGMGDWPNQHVQKIVSLRYFPVCSPRLVNTMGGLKNPEHLAGAPLLHMIDYSDWRVWLAAAGAPNVDVQRGIVFCRCALCAVGVHRRPGHRHGRQPDQRRGPGPGLAGAAVRDRDRIQPWLLPGGRSPESRAPGGAGVWRVGEVAAGWRAVVRGNP